MLAIILRYLKAALLTCLNVFNDFLSVLPDILSTGQPPKYKAEFISASELLSSSNIGFCLDGKRYLSDENSHRNALCIGGTGFGKSSVIAIPTLLNMKDSCIINDPSTELYNLCSGELKKRGFKIRVINFADASKSAGYNPLAHVSSFSDCQKIATMLIRSVLGKDGEPFWKLKATSLLTMLIQILLYQEPKYRNFANVSYLLQLLTTKPKAVDVIVINTKSDKLIGEYKQYLALDYKVQSGIAASVEAALQIFNDPIVALVTSKDTIQFDTLRTEPTAIFIHSSVNDMAYYSTLVSIIFEQITKVIMSDLPKPNDLSVYFALDEMAILYLPTIQSIVSNCRKYRCGVLGLLQAYQQLEHVYGKDDAESISTNCFAKVYFGGQSPQTANQLSQVLGKMEYIDENGATKVRELKTASEIRELPNSKAILIASNYKPILMSLTPYFNNPFLKMKTETKAPVITGDIGDSTVELLNVS